MAYIRAQVVLQGDTLIPEDVFVNTWHFDSGAETMATVAAGLRTVLEAFYVSPLAGPGTRTDSYLSAFITTTATIKLYDLAQPEPRVPLVSTFAITPGNTKLPEEVALCASFHGGAPITARRRGRVYIGPLGTLGVAADVTNVPHRPSTGFMTHLRDAMSRLRTQSLALSTPCIWVIRSTMPNVNYVPVIGGWVDNAWDTQRRRGPVASARLTWSAA